MQLACQCQKIKQVLKEANCSKLVQDWIAERATHRNNGNNGSNKQPIVNSLAIGAAPQLSNSNSMTARMAQIAQPRAQLAAPSVRIFSATTTNAGTPRLSTKEID